MKSFLGVVLLILSLARAFSQSDPIVDWHGRYVTKDIPGVEIVLKEGIPIENGIYYPYQEERPISPVNPAYDQNAPSARFFGAIQMINTTALGDMAGAMNLIRTSDITATAEENVAILSTSRGTSENGFQEVKGLLFWKKENFLNLDQLPESIPLSRLKQFTLDSVQGSLTITMRFAVRDGETWYLSEEYFSGTDGIARLEDPANARWIPWPIDYGQVSLPLVPSDAPVSGNTFRNITAVGFYFESSYTSFAPAAFMFRQFQIH